MKSWMHIVALLAMISTACASSPPTPTSPPASAAESATSPSAIASPPGDALTGTWATGETTCAQQNAAVEAAGFTTEQMTLAGWSPTCAEGMTHGGQYTVRFAYGGLVIFNDGEVGWDGLYRVVDDQTFEAGDRDAGYYITYEFTIVGDQLTIDMIENTCPICSSDAELAGEQIAQTVIYETSPFTRQD